MDSISIVFVDIAGFQRVFGYPQGESGVADSGKT
jgi:hypothetical protein